MWGKNEDDDGSKMNKYGMFQVFVYLIVSCFVSFKCILFYLLDREKKIIFNRFCQPSLYVWAKLVCIVSTFLICKSFGMKQILQQLIIQVSGNNNKKKKNFPGKNFGKIFYLKMSGRSEEGEVPSRGSYSTKKIISNCPR